MIATDTTPPAASRISRKKLLANRRNAQKSTGPKTPEGKQRSSQNAIVHGFFAQNIVTSAEDAQQFKEYRISLLRRLNPRDELELQYAEQVIYFGWKMKRLQTAECEEYNGRIERDSSLAAITRKSIPPAARMTGYQLAKDLFCDNSIFLRFQVYEQRLQNMMNKALKQLQMLQKQESRGALCEFTDKLIDQENGDVHEEKWNEPTKEQSDVSDESTDSSEADQSPTGSDDQPDSDVPSPSEPLEQHDLYCLVT